MEDINEVWQRTPEQDFATGGAKQDLPRPLFSPCFATCDNSFECAIQRNAHHLCLMQGMGKALVLTSEERELLDKALPRSRP